MNWDAIGAVGEMVGAIAVVFSVAYLAVQIRSGSAALSTNIRDSVFASLSQWNYQLTADPEFAWMFHRGLKDFDSLQQETVKKILIHSGDIIKKQSGIQVTNLKFLKEHIKEDPNV